MPRICINLLPYHEHGHFLSSNPGTTLSRIQGFLWANAWKIEVHILTNTCNYREIDANSFSFKDTDVMMIENNNGDELS